MSFWSIALTIRCAKESGRMSGSRKKKFIADIANVESAPPVNMRVTREDWLNLALDTLIQGGVEQVKVLSLREKLGVSRSSFYWYFKSREELLDALLKHWQDTNTVALLDQASAPAETITEAVCNIFKCTVNPMLFDSSLDFSIRDWARRSERVRHILDQSDDARLNALESMFTRFHYEPLDAKTRARVLYYMQIGYEEAELDEPLDQRMALVPHYLRVFTGREANQREVNDFIAYATKINTGSI